MTIQRFKAALTTGYWGASNPEPLVRDDNGDFVKYDDYKELMSKYEKLTQSVNKGLGIKVYQL